MKHPGWVPMLALLAALIACGPTQNLIKTAVARTPAVQSSPTAPASATLNAAQPSDTPQPPDTDTPLPADTDTDTPVPTRTPRPVRTATPPASPTASPTPTATASSTRLPRRGTPAPTFLETVVLVKKQIENFGGQIDIAAGSGQLDCQQSVDSYEYVAARAALPNVPAALAGAYGLYTQGVTLFVSKAADLYMNCKHFLASPGGGGSVPPLQWTVARTAVNDAGQLLRQAIIAAGGTP